MGVSRCGEFSAVEPGGVHTITAADERRRRTELIDASWSAARG